MTEIKPEEIDAVARALETHLAGRRVILKNMQVHSRTGASASGLTRDMALIEAVVERLRS